MLSQSSWNVIAGLAPTARSRRRGCRFALDHALQHRHVGDPAAGRERLVAGEGDLVALVADDDVRVARVHRAAEEPPLPRRLGLDVGDLLGRAHQARGPEPEQVVAQELADRAVAGGHLPDHAVGGGPLLPAAAVLHGAEQRDEAGVLEQGDLRVRRLPGGVTLGGVGGQDGAHEARPLEPVGLGARGGQGAEVGGGGRSVGRLAVERAGHGSPRSRGTGASARRSDRPGRTPARGRCAGAA